MQKYELTQEGYDALAKLGGDVERILAKHTAPIQQPAKKPGWIQRIKQLGLGRGNDKRERLTDVKMQELFGANYRGIIYYNFDKQSTFSSGYSGALDAADHIIPTYVHSCRVVLEREPLFADREIVATVVMSTAQQKPAPASVQGREFINPVHAPQGSVVVGTLVTRDCATGKINPVPTSWLGVCNDGIKINAAARKANLFAELLEMNAKYRQAMLELHTPQQR